jgi:hypothetical protein
MATRSGSNSTANVGKLQEARESLMQHLACRVDCAVTDRGLALYAFPPPPKRGRFGRVVKTEVPSEWNGFPVVDKTQEPADGK